MVLEGNVEGGVAQMLADGENEHREGVEHQRRRMIRSAEADMVRRPGRTDTRENRDQGGMMFGRLPMAQVLISRGRTPQRGEVKR